MNMFPQGSLYELSLSFYGKGKPEQWARFVTEAGFDSGPEDDGPLSARFCGLPTPVAEGALYVTGRFHPCSGDAGDVHWHLVFVQCLGPNPPESITQMSARVGGMAGALKAMQELWPGPAETEVEVEAVIDPKGLGLRAPVAVDFSHELSRDYMGTTVKMASRVLAQSWKVDPPAGLVRDIIVVTDRDATLNVTIKGSMTTVVSVAMLELLEGELWRGLQLLRD
jgi:hypothetical protein